MTCDNVFNKIGLRRKIGDRKANHKDGNGKRVFLKHFDVNYGIENTFFVGTQCFCTCVLSPLSACTCLRVPVFGIGVIFHILRHNEHKNRRSCPQCEREAIADDVVEIDAHCRCYCHRKCIHKPIKAHCFADMLPWYEKGKPGSHAHRRKHKSGTVYQAKHQQHPRLARNAIAHNSDEYKCSSYGREPKF